MKKIKTILAFALALSMCVSLAACGKSDGGEKDDAEEKVTTTAAESVAEEEEAEAESIAETEGTAESVEESSVAEEAETSEADTEESADGISFTELEPFISEIAGKDIDTAEAILRDTFGITSEREDEEAGVPLEGYIFHRWAISDNMIVCGINISEISITTVNGAVENISFLKEYEESDINSILEDGHIISEELKNIGYDTVSPTYGGDQLIAEFSTNCGTVDITYSSNWINLFVSDLH